MGLQVAARVPVQAAIMGRMGGGPILNSTVCSRGATQGQKGEASAEYSNFSSKCVDGTLLALLVTHQTQATVN